MLLNNITNLNKDIQNKIIDLCVNNVNLVNNGFIPTIKNYCDISYLQMCKAGIESEDLLTDEQQNKIKNLYYKIAYSYE